MRCYAIALKVWDEFNADFDLLYLSSYRSIKYLHIYFKNVEKQLCVLFCVFQTNFNKAVNIFCKLPEMIKNLQMIVF